MTVTNVVRPIKPDDNFELIDSVFYRTHYEGKQEWMNKHKITYRKEDWKQLLFPDSSAVGPAVLKGLSLSGFVAENRLIVDMIEIRTECLSIS